MGLIKAIKRQAKVIASAVLADIGLSAKSRTLLERSRRIDHRNFRAIRNTMSLDHRDHTAVDRILAAASLVAECHHNGEDVIIGLLSESQSQICQDILAVLVFEQKRGGTFVEIGVGNGKSISNTYLLENKFGWNGLLIEPCRSFHSSISKQRNAKLDTRAASSTSNSELQFFETIDNGEFSYASNAMSKAGRAPSRKQFTAYKVQTAKLDEIFAEHNMPLAIDFISLDTEGSEIDILKGLDLTKYKVGLFCIEHNNRPGSVAALDKILLPNGFHRIMPITSAYDAWFVHKSIVSQYL